MAYAAYAHVCLVRDLDQGYEDMKYRKCRSIIQLCVKAVSSAEYNLHVFREYLVGNGCCVIPHVPASPSSR